MRIRDLSLQLKVPVLTLGGLLLIAAIIANPYILDITLQAEIGILEKSQAVVYTTEAARNATEGQCRFQADETGCRV
jgi:hypothetical protein